MSSSHYFLPHKIHYQIFDALGRVERVLVDSDAKENTGKVQSDNKGKRVEGIDQVLSYDFNVKGEEIEIRYDNDVDGVDDTREYLVLNANGDVLEKYTNMDNKETGVSYNLNGESITGIDSIEIYTVDAKGNTVETRYNLDASKDNSIEKIEYFELDANDNPIRQFTNLDGEVSTGKTHTVNGKTVQGIDTIHNTYYTPQGDVKRVEFDLDADSIIDQINYNVRDANGYLIETYQDLDAKDTTGKTFEVNGESFTGIDVRDERLNNAKGHLTRYSNDSNGDGKVDHINYDVRDASGNIIGIHYDADADSSSGNTVTDVNGRVIQGIERSVFFKLNGRNQVVQVDYDYGSDNSIEEVVYEDKNAYGHFLGKYADIDNNPKTGASYTLSDGRVVYGVDNTTIYEVNERGHWIKAEFDYNADKTADKIEYYIKTPEDKLEAVYWDWDGKTNTGYTHTINGKEVQGIDRYNKHVLNAQGQIIDASLSFDGDKIFEQHNYDVRDSLNRIVELYQDTDNNPKTGNTYQTVDGRTVHGIEIAEVSRKFNQYDALIEVIQERDGEVHTTFRNILSPNNQVLYREFISPMRDKNDIQLTSIDFHETTTHHEDITTSDWAERFKTVGGRLHLINFLDDSTKDALTLDKASIAALSGGLLNIMGNSDKTVNLKDITEDSKSHTFSHNGQDYDRYLVEIGGKDYTINIDTDITVNFGEI